MSSRTKIIIAILVLEIILVFSWWVWDNYKISKELTVITDKIKYEKEGVLKVTIKNNSYKNACFSSCYPYYLEKNNEFSLSLSPVTGLLSTGWKPYYYSLCREVNINETCLNAGSEKSFEIDFYRVENGLHRIAVQACIDCKIGEIFIQDRIFYSNEFIIK